MKHYHISVTEEYAGQRIDKVAALLLTDVSRSEIQKAINEGNVKLNNVAILSSKAKVKPGDRIEIAINDPVLCNMAPANIGLDVFYEDDELIIINKQAGLVVHPGAGNYQDTLANALLFHTNSLSDVGGLFRPGIVHRLDKDTSGLMVV